MVNRVFNSDGDVRSNNPWDPLNRGLTEADLVQAPPQPTVFRVKPGEVRSPFRTDRQEEDRLDANENSQVAVLREMIQNIKKLLHELMKTNKPLAQSLREEFRNAIDDIESASRLHQKLKELVPVPSVKIGKQYPDTVAGWEEKNRDNNLELKSLGMETVLTEAVERLGKAKGNIEALKALDAWTKNKILTEGPGAHDGGS